MRTPVFALPLLISCSADPFATCWTGWYFDGDVTATITATDDTTLELSEKGIGADGYADWQACRAGETCELASYAMEMPAGATSEPNGGAVGWIVGPSEVDMLFGASFAVPEANRSTLCDAPVDTMTADFGLVYQTGKASWYPDELSAIRDLAKPNGTEPGVGFNTDNADVTGANEAYDSHLVESESKGSWTGTTTWVPTECAIKSIKITWDLGDSEPERETFNCHGGALL